MYCLVLFFALSWCVSSVPGPVKYSRHNSCSKSEDVHVKTSIKNTSTLEHFEPKNIEGDLCRNSKTGGYFCPFGCLKIGQTPHCKERGSSPTKPCRISGLDKKEISKQKSVSPPRQAPKATASTSTVVPIFLKKSSSRAETNNSPSVVNSTLTSNGKGTRQLVRVSPSSHKKDWVFGFGAELNRSISRKEPYSDIARCDFFPELLPSHHNSFSSRIITARNSMYEKRVDENKANAENFDVSFTSMLGNVKLRIGGKDNVMGWSDEDAVYSSMWNDSHVVPGLHRVDSKAEFVLGWRELTHEQRNACDRCDRRIVDDSSLYIIANSWPGHYGHFLHDTVALIGWLERYRIPKENKAKYGIVSHAVHRKVLQWLDPSLHDRVIWLHLGQTHCFRRSKHSVIAVQLSQKNDKAKLEPVYQSKARYLNNWALSSAFSIDLEKRFRSQTPRSSRSILFYSPMNEKKPSLSEEQVFELFKTVADVMTAHGRKERLIRYTPGSDTSLEAHFAYFRQADFVVAPKGSGLINMVWMALGKSCDTRKVLLEFSCVPDVITSRGSCNDGSPMANAWDLAGGAPFLRFKHMLLSGTNSTTPKQLTSDNHQLKAALNQIFEEEYEK